MKLEEAYLIVENYDKVKNQDGMSARVNEAINALDKDIEKIRDIVENKRRIELTWNDLSSKHFKELMCNFYELADGSSKLLNDRKKYDLNPTGPIAKNLLRNNPKIANNSVISTAIKNIEIYNQIYQKIKELSVWIRKYNKMGYSLNIPSMEFGISLKEVYNDYRKDKANNATN
jgi:hypothetical protein